MSTKDETFTLNDTQLSTVYRCVDPSLLKQHPS